MIQGPRRQLAHVGGGHALAAAHREQRRTDREEYRRRVELREQGEAAPPHPREERLVGTPRDLRWLEIGEKRAWPSVGDDAEGERPRSVPRVMPRMEEEEDAEARGLGGEQGVPLATLVGDLDALFAEAEGALGDVMEEEHAPAVEAVENTAVDGTAAGGAQAADASALEAAVAMATGFTHRAR